MSLRSLFLPPFICCWKSSRFFTISFSLGSDRLNPVDSNAWFKWFVKYWSDLYKYIWSCKLYTLRNWAMEMLSMLSVSSQRKTSKSISSTLAKSWGSTSLEICGEKNGYEDTELRDDDTPDEVDMSAVTDNGLVSRPPQVITLKIVMSGWVLHANQSY